ncbi:sufE-like protein 2, chloroplastic [Gossypium arboreum]|uniref:Fe-S metabolism associated domain-containing protein n=1 Tax=Gossypium arboreum TaxID=29729 RepID=A0ABR0Q259_GOSAR|nr:sufE-like protein 2, chloroplastic [Gossypium arboreum]KAK5833424.1 hypothetical protein PVK06_017252 [Gossypium arboreum]
MTSLSIRIPFHCFFDKHYFPNTKNIHLKLPRADTIIESNKFSGKSDLTKSFVVSSKIQTPWGTTYKQGVSHKVQLLVSEFKSLTEPIDRVKRLLYYGEMLAPFDEAARLPENRVKGCTTQVWVDARIDKNGKVRFRADSDSEISKGFCSCLIWVMDGADPEEVVGVTAEELVELNVGVHGKVQSRVNTWQNVLIYMRNKTAALMEERQVHQLKPPRFSSLLFSTNEI